MGQFKGRRFQVPLVSYAVDFLVLMQQLAGFFLEDLSYNYASNVLAKDECIARVTEGVPGTCVSRHVQDFTNHEFRFRAPIVLRPFNCTRPPRRRSFPRRHSGAELASPL